METRSLSHPRVAESPSSSWLPGSPLFGLLTANIAAFFIEDDSSEDSATGRPQDQRQNEDPGIGLEDDAVRAKLDELLLRVKELEAMLIEQRSA